MRLLFAALALAIPLSAIAEPVACPDAATVKQVNACPTTEELQYTFDGYCGSNARLYSPLDTTCESFESYRKLKDIALWESTDGQFANYLSCDMPKDEMAKAKPVSISVSQKKGITMLRCDYSNGTYFVQRSRTKCTVPAEGTCPADGPCVAQCE
ncbi:hypothetical protein [Denitromonas ohlonensis]|jgi:hypothetical protein|uniref:Uncharacterized protein n=2 Tax=Denitromonas TaxID=139331 RepID=A0A558ET16_9RHOO|nr:hypothetical protein [Denitromonas ohlonensis]TVT48001.1 MAG: hypothetical protein FHP94_12060 [Denitromonas halophila]TVO59568.1 hypothetical protein FHP90_20005 [Denitromonas ohlonensis]TVO76392.1 hypothetical protein FHP89_10940 [Denitromonas ohlonensis]TVT69139.1 MAG: hypothetical protein FHP93_14225 [Denitromonas halophila]TVT76541.1 MAG: hypothetical protein FHP92_07735 [Denitromonas halophila]